MDILAFGIAKEIIGNSTASIEWGNPTTAGDLKRLIEKEYPAFKKLGSYMIAVNNEYATDETIINKGDDVAIIPPVSGG